MSRYEGTFIVFEGGEGSGKSTQIEMLESKLPDDTVITKEPGGTPAADRMRDILLDADLALTDKAELALLCASRADHVAGKVKPALKKGRIVISDRFDLSTIAYQIYARENEEDIEYLKKFSDYVVGDCQPDMYIYLDIPVSEGLSRLGGRDEENSRIDQEEVDFHERVRSGYKKVVKNRDDCVLIDASKSKEAVSEKVWNVMKEII